MGNLGLVTPRPNRQELGEMARIAHLQMTSGGAVILDELGVLLQTFRKVMDAGMKRAEQEEVGERACPVCKRKPDTGFRLAIDAATGSTKSLDLCARLLAEIKDREALASRSYATSPEWIHLRKMLGRVLQKHPAVATELVSLLREEGYRNDAAVIEDEASVLEVTATDQSSPAV